jgi:hypothetical protein
VQRGRITLWIQCATPHESIKIHGSLAVYRPHHSIKHHLFHCSKSTVTYTHQNEVRSRFRRSRRWCSRRRRVLCSPSFSQQLCCSFTYSCPRLQLLRVIAARSASPIHLLPLTARNGKFYLGAGAPTSYCPPEVPAGSCPSGDNTVFSGGDGLLGLGVVVPGGQQVYVAKNGELSYTVPHSAAIPEGAVVDQFSKTAPGANNLGTLDFETGFVACPVGGDGQGYQVYGQNQGFEASSDCLGFSALTCEF